MTDIRFDRLVDLPLRDAWKHEAHEFTPWLARNIDHLSEAIGVELELTDTEVAVDTFSADILARDRTDDRIVLIENQLETTDHTHLGQIMTYLAGLEAQIVIWIAPDFREPHISAINWLNEHTADGFSFFAVKARVVRIADSPYAPIFEVAAKPNDWQRRISAKRRQASGETSAIGEKRRSFWEAYVARHPHARNDGITLTRLSHCWFTVIPDTVHVVVWAGSPSSGIYVRGGYGAGPERITELLEPHVEALAGQLGADIGGKEGKFLHRRVDMALDDDARWEELIDWMEAHRKAYIAAISDILETDQ
jgi:hypothetical protein